MPALSVLLIILTAWPTRVVKRMGNIRLGMGIVQGLYMLRMGNKVWSGKQCTDGNYGIAYRWEPVRKLRRWLSRGYTPGFENEFWGVPSYFQILCLPRLSAIPLTLIPFHLLIQFPK